VWSVCLPRYDLPYIAFYVFIIRVFIVQRGTADETELIPPSVCCFWEGPPPRGPRRCGAIARRGTWAVNFVVSALARACVVLVRCLSSQALRARVNSHATFDG